jgi:Tfp pilus assembly protein FimT
MPLLIRSAMETAASAHEDGTPTKSARRGTTLMEYLMMLSLIVVFCMVAIGIFGNSNNGSMTNSANAINSSLKKGS